jgi:predicted nucleic acid-binding protein
LDACSLIAYLAKEPGWDKLFELFYRAANAEVDLYIHALNLYEVYYDIQRRAGREAATGFLSTFEESYAYIGVFGFINNTLSQTAAHYKLNYTMSLADSIALATASLLQASLITADHHEFDPIEKAQEATFFWFR